MCIDSEAPGGDFLVGNVDFGVGEGTRFVPLDTLIFLFYVSFINLK